MNFTLFLLRTLTKSCNRSLVMIKLQQRLFWCAGNSPMSLSHLYIKEWRLEELCETQHRFESAKTLLKLLCINTLRISYKLSYLRNSRVLSDLYCEHHWLYIKCSTPNIFLCNCVSLEISFVLEHMKPLPSVLEYWKSLVVCLSICN